MADIDLLEETTASFNRSPTKAEPGDWIRTSRPL